MIREVVLAGTMAIAVFVFGGAAMADTIIDYSLSGAYFDSFSDNGNLAETVSGTWTVDYTTMEVSAMSLTATGGETITFDLNDVNGIAYTGGGGATQFEIGMTSTEAGNPFFMDYQASGPTSLLVESYNSFTTNLYDLEGGYSPPSSVGELTASSIYSVPEPASWALMLVGFGGLGATLRTRRRVAIAQA